MASEVTIATATTVTVGGNTNPSECEPIKEDIAKLATKAASFGINPALLRVVRVDAERGLVGNNAMIRRTLLFAVSALRVLTATLRCLDVWRAGRHCVRARRSACGAGCSPNGACHLVQCASVNAHGVVSPPEVRFFFARDGAARAWLGGIAIAALNAAPTPARGGGGGGDGGDLEQGAIRWQHVALAATSDEMDAAAEYERTRSAQAATRLQYLADAVAPLGAHPSAAPCLAVPLDAMAHAIQMRRMLDRTHGLLQRVAMAFAVHVAVFPFAWCPEDLAHFAVFFDRVFDVLCCAVSGAVTTSKPLSTCATDSSGTCVFHPRGSAVRWLDGGAKGAQLLFNATARGCAQASVFFNASRQRVLVAEMRDGETAFMHEILTRVDEMLSVDRDDAIHKIFSAK